MLDLIFEDKTNGLSSKDKEMLHELLDFAADYLKLTGEATYIFYDFKNRLVSAKRRR